jgi:hypothetical protein
MKYALIKGTYLTDGEIHIGYGIGYTENNALSFEDLALNPISVAKLVNLCNELDLSHIHLNDVVEDFLIEST